MRNSLHPQAKFDPIAPDLDLNSLVDRTPNFKWVQRVSRQQIRSLGQQEFEKLLLLHVVVSGKPLVIDGWDAVLPKWLFNVNWLEKTYDKKQENVRDITSANDVPMTTGHYLRAMKQLTHQWTPTNYRDEHRQRLYLKDIDCPPEWHDALQKVIHPNLFYLNENASETGGAKPEDEVFREEATAAPAGDLMSSLPEEMRAENLMCYIGHEGTYTPAHREMCASLGQNIMVEASSDEGGEKKGSSIWFMTESKDREVVREYFLSMLGHDIEIEKHFAQINAWKKAPFDVYVVEQKAGDFILIPPLAAHQVWNRGTRTMKVAWNRTTVETLELALQEALPKARLVCRDEQYKNKAIIYHTLAKYNRQLVEMEKNARMAQMSFLGLGEEIMRSSPRAKQLASDFKKLFSLFTDIILDEMFGLKEKDVEFIPFDSNITCSYCRSNIFNRFLTCKHCIRTLVNGDEDTYDICMECYAMGRSCACISNLQWCEQWSWTELVGNYEAWRSTVIKNDGFVDFESSPRPLEVARLSARKKSVAQICQEALRRRPWKDITNPERDNTPSESEPDGEEKPKKKKRKKKKGEVRRCHVCAHKDYTYRVHSCTNPGCSESYCYGVLYRAFDMMPQKVLEDEQWQCPKCLGICNCGYCRRVGHTNPYMPKNTLLGHDTRPIADDRSTEALVDFRVHNLSWLKAAGEESRSKDSKRMKRLREQADNAKAQDITGQVEAGSTLHDDSRVENGDSNTLPTHTMDGYGNESHVVGQNAHPVLEVPMERSFLHSPKENGGATNNPEAPPEMLRMEDPDASLYPDPSPIVARQRFGMGYYEQDDTPDKILFDPFQIPSEETVRFPETDLPESVRKSIRAAKRRAKRDNEDPDFTVGKSHHKKSRLTSEPDLLDNMDPALFSGGPSAPEAAMEGPSRHDANQSVNIRAVIDTNAAETPETTLENPLVKKKIMYDANEPSLRHAKPRTSYAELDVDPEEDEDEQTVTRMPSLPRGVEGSGKIAVDNTADAVHALLEASNKTGGEHESSSIANSLASRKIPKKRGRPPKNASSTPGQKKSPVATRPDGHALRRGRRRRVSALSQVTGANDSSVFQDAETGKNGSDNEHDKIVEELEAQLAKELEATAASTNTPKNQSRPRGRPRKPSTTTITSHKRALEDFNGNPEVTTPTATDSRAARSARRSNRSAVNSTSTPVVKKSTGSEGSTQLLSMAERMALQGKKFRIGTRKTNGTSRGLTVALPGVSPRASNANPSLGQGNKSERPSRKASSGVEYYSDHQDSSSKSQSPSPARPSRAASSVVVRLIESDSEEETSSPSSNSDLDSNDDIPARRGLRSLERQQGNRKEEQKVRGRKRRWGRGRA